MASRKITKRAGMPPLSGTLASAATASEAIGACAELRDRVGRAPRSAADRHAGGRRRSATSSAGSRCASLASSIAARRRRPAGTSVEPARDRRIGGEREDCLRDRASPIASPTGPSASSPSALRPARRDHQMRPRRRASWRKAASRSSSMPSTGSATMRFRRRSMTTGRPERNSARPRSTATCSGAPNSGRNTGPDCDYSPTRAPVTSTPIDNNPKLAQLFPRSGCRLLAFSRSVVVNYHDTMTTAPKDVQRTGRKTAPPAKIIGARSATDSDARSWADVPADVPASEARPARALAGDFRPAAAGPRRRPGGGRPVRPVDRRPHRHRRAAIRTTSMARPASPICIGCARWSMRWWSGRHRARRRSAIDRPPGRRPEPGARRDRSQRPAARRPRALLAADGIRRLVITGERTRDRAARRRRGRAPAATPDGQIAPAAILAALAARGFRRILIEGGANTVSRFLAAGCLDRLHVVIAPIIIGAGPSSVTLPPIARVEQALRAPMRAHVLGEEVLLDCDLSAQRIAGRGWRRNRRDRPACVDAAARRRARAGALEPGRDARSPADRRARCAARGPAASAPPAGSRDRRARTPNRTALHHRVADALETRDRRAPPPPVRAPGRIPCRRADAGSRRRRSRRRTARPARASTRPS